MRAGGSSNFRDSWGADCRTFPEFAVCGSGSRRACSKSAAILGLRHVTTAVWMPVALFACSLHRISSLVLQEIALCEVSWYCGGLVGSCGLGLVVFKVSELRVLLLAGLDGPSAGLHTKSVF